MDLQMKLDILSPADISSLGSKLGARELSILDEAISALLERQNRLIGGFQYLSGSSYFDDCPVCFQHISEGHEEGCPLEGHLE